VKLREIANLLNADILIGAQRLEDEVFSACGSDMMSDVLAFVKDQAVLLTGLTNPQVIRTALMMDIRCVVFVRDKRPADDVLPFSDESGITVMATPLRMYEACGRLYEAGLGR